MSDTPIAVEVNCETQVVTTRPLTAEEIAAQAEADAKAKADADAAKAAAKDAAIAKLAAIGLTADDVNALLG